MPKYIRNGNLSTTQNHLLYFIIFNQNMTKRAKSRRQILQQRRQTAKERERSVAEVQKFQLNHDEPSHLQTKKEKTFPHPISKVSIKNLTDSKLRIQRSKTQNIYLFKAELQVTHTNEQWWRFTVFGASGNDYSLIIKKDQLLCGCADFRMRGNLCKHFYFIITQVAKCEEVLRHVRKNTKKLKPQIFQMLNKALKRRLRILMEGEGQVKSGGIEGQKMMEGKMDAKKQVVSRCKQEEKIEGLKLIEFKDEEVGDCMICFLEMAIEGELLSNCPQCHKYFHGECLSAWKKKSQTCPYCRMNLDKDILPKIAMKS